MKNIRLKKIAVCGSLLMSSVGFNCAMEPKQEQQNITINQQEQQNSSGYNIVNLLKNIKSNYIIQKIFNYQSEKTKLNIIRYNKKFKNKLNISLKNYHDYNIVEAGIEVWNLKNQRIM